MEMESTNKIKPKRMRKAQASVNIYSSEFDSKVGNVHPYAQPCWCHPLLILPTDDSDTNTKMANVKQ